MARKSLEQREIAEMLRAKHDDLMGGFQKVLMKAGIHGIDISRIGLFVKEGDHRCPEGQTAVWELTVKPNGEIEGTWVCK
jgi:hypothetical protein